MAASIGFVGPELALGSSSIFIIFLETLLFAGTALGKYDGPLVCQTPT
jgi:hypothetical protein